METLIALLFSNLIPIIIVVSIIVRIYLSMKNAANSRKKVQAPAPVQEEDDDEVTWMTPEQELYREEASPSEPAVSSLAPAINTIPGGDFSAEILKAWPGETRAPLPSRESQKTPGKPPVFRRIDALPPLQQAIVLAEILGTPKGMQQ
jgi:hypothetical protein